ncbi:D-aminoacyl-tRNA deacylase [Clostridia bacterium]|nr:D-aminoacyl-tRNA deacylase [Clostridia bacterium]
MKAVIQRVSHAEVKVDNAVKGSIAAGFLVLIGVEIEDDEKDAEKLAAKIAVLRVFCDNKDKMNLSLKDINGQVLVISNFTLCGDCSHGRRPYFGAAAIPSKAEPLYEHFCTFLSKNGVGTVEKGVFGADMKVALVNDGPVTIMLSSKEI